MKKFTSTGIAMSEPLAFRRCDDTKMYIYLLLTWTDGINLSEALPALSGEAQYLLGRQAGDILKKLHSIPVDPLDLPVETKKAK